MKTNLSLLLLLFVGTFAHAQYTAFVPEELVVTANSLNLRAEPNINSKKIASVPRGATLKFLEAHDQGAYVLADTLDPNGPYAPWYKVTYQNKTGYVFGAHVAGKHNIYFDGQFMEYMPNGLHWYGVYARDSFADEVRKIEVKIAEEFNELYGDNAKILRTNQTDRAKFLLATTTPMKTGYCSPIGSLDVNTYYYTTILNPGATVSLYRGNDFTNPADTLGYATYSITATGCVELRDNVPFYSNYKLTLFDYSMEAPYTQDLTSWFQTIAPEIAPNVSLYWQGDLDQDGKPDALIQDCPEEVGCRVSLFLTTQANKDDRWKKVCEAYFMYD